MRGTYLAPFNRALLSEESKNGHQFLEQIVLSDVSNDSDISIHMLIPTQFGVYLNKARFEKVFALWETATEEDVAILIRQDGYTCQCVRCQKQLELNERMPYQMCLRAFGTRKDGAEFQYDLLFGFLCHRCQTSHWHSWVPIVEDCYIDFCRVVREYVFVDTLQIKPEHESGLDIVDVYLKRFDRLNQMIPQVLDYVTNTHICFHCNQACSERCKKCKALCFCSNKPSADHRADGKLSCAELASQYHDIGGTSSACYYLRTNQLFLLKFAMYVDDEWLLR